MYFLMNLETDRVSAHRSNRAACSEGLWQLGIVPEQGQCPVRLLFDHEAYGKKFFVRNLSDLLKGVSDLMVSGDIPSAIELNNLIRESINDYYARKNRR